MVKNDQKAILIDADVVSHFISAGEEEQLNKIYPFKILLLDKVHAELQKWPHVGPREAVSRLFQKKIVHLTQFPEENPQIKKEYAWIKSVLFKGDGESACLAVARFSKHILASSNLRDIASYCSMHSISYLTTMDFLCEALKKGIFTIERCNRFIAAVINKNGKLPVKKMNDHKCREVDV